MAQISMDHPDYNRFAEDLKVDIKNDAIREIQECLSSLTDDGKNKLIELLKQTIKIQREIRRKSQQPGNFIEQGQKLYQKYQDLEKKLNDAYAFLQNPGDKAFELLPGIEGKCRIKTGMALSGVVSVAVGSTVLVSAYQTGKGILTEAQTLASNINTLVNTFNFPAFKEELLTYSEDFLLDTISVLLSDTANKVKDYVKTKLPVPDQVPPTQSQIFSTSFSIPKETEQ